MTRLFVLGAVVCFAGGHWLAFVWLAVAATAVAIYNGAREGWREMREQDHARNRRARRY